ncbi:MAG: tetratricopeptide repeat protein, partial [Actinomycetota bacterium]|nr:tetratricopeptide repeat protein [Actinomycetota bacterium]
MSPERMAAQVAGWEQEVAAAVAAGSGGVLGARVLLVRANRFAGRDGESVAIARAHLAACESTVGADDPLTLAAGYELAQSLAAAGQHAESVAGLRPALAGQERVLGADH